jgi:hypothetical protein
LIRDNTNKEFDWALTEATNTGLTAYNKAVMTDYFGGLLPIKSAAPVEEAMAVCRQWLVKDCYREKLKV